MSVEKTSVKLLMKDSTGSKEEESSSHKLLIEEIKDSSEENSKDQPNDNTQFVIRDTATGATYDVRSKEFCSGAYIDPSENNKDSLQKKYKLNSKLLRGSEVGNMEEVKNSLDPVINGGLMADINTKELNDFTPLHNAVGEGHLNVVKYLIENGSEIDAVTTGGRTALHMACYNGNKEIIEYLVSKGSEINIQENEGNTPTHILAQLGWSDALSFLLELNPVLTIKNNYGQTAPEISTNIDIKKLFSSYNADQKSGYERTIIDKVILHNNRADMIRSLMFKGQMLANAPEVQQEETKVRPKEVSDMEKRRTKIIEATRKIKDVVNPDGSKVMNQENFKPVGPEDFQPIKLLGKGSFGQVYLVKHTSSGKLYAMKALNKEKFMSKNLLKYAVTERNVMSYSHHPFIVGLYYAFQTSSKLFLILDYCPGYS